ncbi:MAG: membrane protein insertion efficiency factor YidD, partial [Candidatus Doudnabacteria bacterium]|nr:membrane protein insertion efficiency factor YidD [Candidatus Doudnabacteria bacterium]
MKYGVFSGLALAVRRIIRCHPWQKPSIDLVP